MLTLGRMAGSLGGMTDRPANRQAREAKPFASGSYLAAVGRECATDGSL